jgi:hypothetical protein
MRKQSTLPFGNALRNAPRPEKWRYNMDKYQLAVLADDYETKRLIFEAHSLANTPSDPDERRKGMISYHIAEAEMIEAATRLWQAKYGLTVNP